jgi:hypothetical protein
MKTINEYVNESLLDDEETLINDTKPIIIHKLKKLSDYIPARDNGIDCYGRKLNIGDIILYHNDVSTYFGIIIKFTGKNQAWCLVSSEGDPDRTCETIYCKKTIKLTEKQFLEITKDIK